MNLLETPWIVLFGGAGREGCVQRMVDEGIRLRAIVVPARRSQKLDAAVARLRPLSCPIVEAERSTLPSVLRDLAGGPLLSIGFPMIVPAELLEHFAPALNIHPTLLPQYRGPTTAAYVLLNDEKESGSTVHLMTQEMDRGAIVAQSRVALHAFDTIRSLQRKVYANEPQLVIEALRALSDGKPPKPQDESRASEYPKRRTPEDSEVDPTRSLEQLFNEIRACDPDDFPAFFYHRGQKVCIRLWRADKPAGAEDEI